MFSSCTFRRMGHVVKCYTLRHVVENICVAKIIRCDMLTKVSFSPQMKIIRCDMLTKVSFSPQMDREKLNHFFDICVAKMIRCDMLSQRGN